MSIPTKWDLVESTWASLIFLMILMPLTVGIIDEHLIALVFLCLYDTNIFLTLIRLEEYEQLTIPQAD